MYKYLARTLFVGKNLVFMPSCHSTNQVAYDKVSEDHVSEGTIVITDYQTAGRGQMGNTWESEPGCNLMFTLILRPTFLPMGRQFDLNRTISLALTDWLRTYSTQFTIKWPNDIFFTDQKIGGILIQNILRNKRIEYSLIGIGLNINQESFQVPKAISLTRITGKTFQLESLLEDLAVSIEQRYLQLRGNGFPLMKSEYTERLFRFGQPQTFQDMEKGLFEGTIRDVEPDGQLVVECDGGQKKFQFREIAYVY